MNAGSFDPEAFVSGEGFAGDFQQYALEDWFVHGRAVPSVCTSHRIT
jgi:hypothetical protein